MAIKEVSFKTKGMVRDLAMSAFSPEFAYENMNMRYQTGEDNSLLALTMEKSTLYQNTFVQGTVLGCCNFEDSIVVFSCQEYTETDDDD